MTIPLQWIRPFPSYEDVFYDQLDKHREHFLPLCSINLQCIEEGYDEWVHLVSTKEVYEGCVGEETTSYHNAWTKEDMFAFDVIDGKYRFASDWNYFKRHQEQSAQNSDLADPYEDNERDYASRKVFYELTGQLYPYASFGTPFPSVDAVKKAFAKKTSSGWGLSYPEMNDILDDVDFQSTHMQSLLDEGESLEELRLHLFDQTNLLHVPKQVDGGVFPYIASLTGFFFQAYGADSLYLFYEKSLGIAVICLEYT